jgi:soluble lytic murein transglycosylase
MVVKRKKGARFFLILILLVILFLAGMGGMKLYYRICYPRDYSQYVRQYAAEYGLDENLIYAVIKTESGFRPDAVSANNAKGLTQITSDTFDWISSKLGYVGTYSHDDLYDPKLSIEYGAFFLSYLMNEFGDVKVALCAYHAGRGITNQWLLDPAYSSDGKVLDEIPYSDTAHYVKKAYRNYQIYQKLYTNQ